MGCADISAVISCQCEKKENEEAVAARSASAGV